uniref:Putative secreted peptide n=1 Tax=Anopheles braziliensis TaxID=58242 RepID=A0A2M3ZRH2_9DIPT
MRTRIRTTSLVASSIGTRSCRALSCPRSIGATSLRTFRAVCWRRSSVASGRLALASCRPPSSRSLHRGRCSPVVRPR